MHKASFLTAFVVFVAMPINLLFAEVKSYPPVGSVQQFFSSNKEYSVEIKVLGNVDKDPCECTFKHGDTIIWQKQLPETAGKVAISNNGKFIACLFWSSYDKQWFHYITIYNNKGGVVLEDPLGGDEFGVERLEILDTGECVLISAYDGSEYKFKAGE